MGGTSMKHIKNIRPLYKVVHCSISVPVCRKKQSVIFYTVFSKILSLVKSDAISSKTKMKQKKTVTIMTIFVDWK
jgi:hypothetical protein